MSKAKDGAVGQWGDGQWGDGGAEDHVAMSAVYRARIHDGVMGRDWRRWGAERHDDFTPPQKFRSEVSGPSIKN